DRCTCMSLASFVHPDTTADLQAMHDLLAAAGLSFWLVRHTWGGAIAVAESCPGIAAADTGRGGMHPLRGDGLNGMETVPGIVRVGRSADTGLWVEVERWDVGAQSGPCPRATALPRDQCA